MSFSVKPVDNLVFDPIEHRYELNGKWIPGCTTITSLISKPWLVPWAAKMVAETASKMIMPNTPYSEKELAKILLTAKQAPNKRKEGAADKGKIAHGLIERYIKHAMSDKLPGVNDGDSIPDPDIRNSLAGFNEWEKQYKPKWLASELLICSTKHEYAGTLDAVAEIGGKILILDWKTGKSVPDDVPLQVVGGYGIAYEEMGGSFDGGAVLHCPAESGKRWEYIELKEEDYPAKFCRETFLHLREIQKWCSFIKSKKGEK